MKKILLSVSILLLLVCGGCFLPRPASKTYTVTYDIPEGIVHTGGDRSFTPGFDLSGCYVEFGTFTGLPLGYEVSSVTVTYLSSGKTRQVDAQGARISVRESIKVTPSVTPIRYAVRYDNTVTVAGKQVEWSVTGEYPSYFTVEMEEISLPSPECRNYAFEGWLMQTEDGFVPFRGFSELYHSVVLKAEFSDFVFSWENGLFTLTEYVGEGGAVVIPEEYRGEPVTAINADAFTDAVGITQLILPASVQRIDTSDIFWANTSEEERAMNMLAEIGVSPQSPYFYTQNGCLIERESETVVFTERGATLPSGVRRIGEYAFLCRPASKYAIPDSVTFIGDYAFSHCPNLTEVSFGAESRLTEMGKSIFWGTALTSLHLPGSLRTVPDLGVQNKLHTLTLGEGIQSIQPHALQNLLSLRYLILPDSCLAVGEAAFRYSPDVVVYASPSCNLSDAEAGTVWRITEDTLLQTEDFHYVIADGAATVTAVIGEGVLHLPASVAVKGVAYPVSQIAPSAVRFLSRVDSFTVSDEQAFYSEREGAIADATGKLVIGGKNSRVAEGITAIGSHSFHQSGITEIALPSSVLRIEEWAFSESALQKITLSEGLTEIGVAAFAKSAIESVQLPKSLALLGRNAFYMCSSLQSVQLAPDCALRVLPENCFNRCERLQAVRLPDGLQKIGEGAFSLCASLAELSLPYGLQQIGRNAFYGNPSLTSLFIPESVQYVGEYAFAWGNRSLALYLKVGTDLSGWDPLWNRYDHDVALAVQWV